MHDLVAEADLEPDGPLRILVLSWRDGRHPEAGGAEVFLEKVTARFAERGHEVTVMSARYPGSLSEEVSERRRLLRRGGRFTVYPHGMRVAAAGRRRYDVVVDIQNGIPFWTPLVTRVPVVNVVHHVHREQWPEVFGRTRARLGWWLESSAAPLAYRSARYLAVSTATRDELVGLGVAPERVDIVLSGLDAPVSTVDYDPVGAPSMVVLGRLVPHKRVEVALEALARLRPSYPDLTLTVIGQGYWLPDLIEHAARLGVDKCVRFAGFVSDREKADLLSAARVNLLPSMKEGWGLSIVEAAALGTPSVALRTAGGTAESIVDGETGLLADDEADFVHKVSRILDDGELRSRLSDAARTHAAQFSWERTGDGVLRVLRAAIGDRRRGGQPPS